MISATGFARFHSSTWKSLSPTMDPFGAEEQECAEICRRSTKSFRTISNDQSIDIRPMFPGCGFVDASTGDVHSYGTLYEGKSGERAFRSIDVRQLLTYVALSKASGSWDIDRIGPL